MDYAVDGGGKLLEYIWTWDIEHPERWRTLVVDAMEIYVETTYGD